MQTTGIFYCSYVLQMYLYADTNFVDAHKFPAMQIRNEFFRPYIADTNACAEF